MNADPNPPKTASDLRFRILGAWQLESYKSVPVSSTSSSKPIYPMGKNVQGMILYTSDGYLSAQLYIPGQKPFSVEEASESQWAEAAKRYFGYCGPYYITEEEGKVRLRHGFRYANRPNLVKEIQIREWRFEDEGKLLVISSEEAEEVKGELRMPELRWRQMPNNIAGTPPENMH